MTENSNQTQPAKTAKTSGKGRPRKRKVYKLSIFILIIMMLVAGAFLAMIAVVDAFPPNIVGYLIAVLAALLLVSALLLFRKRRWVRAIGVILAVVFVAVYGMGIYYMSTTYAMFSKISSEESAQVDNQGLNVTEDSFNIYVTGIDQWKKEKGLDLERSDVNMIITVCPKTRKIMLTSIPRDAYVPLHRTGTMDKLTHTGIYGVEETLLSAHDWLGIDFNYYVKANFTGFVRLVHAIGGIDIYNPYEFTSSLTGHTYPKGNIHLKSYGALYYARERKAFEGEDQLRVRNQLIVVEAIINKILSSSALITSYGEIMDVLGDEVQTNMPASDMQELIKMQLSDMRSWDIESQRMSGEYEMEIVASMDPSNKYQVLKVSQKSFNDCLEGIERTMNPTQEEIEKAETEKKQASLMNFIKSLKNRGHKDTEEGEETED